jgi:hypothetical protein
LALSPFFRGPRWLAEWAFPKKKQATKVSNHVWLIFFDLEQIVATVLLKKLKQRPLGIDRIACE